MNAFRWNCHRAQALAFCLICMSMVSAGSRAAPPPNVTFLGNWNDSPVVGQPQVWRFLHTWAPDRIVGVIDPTFPKQGAVVARIQVEPGDQVGGWTGERAEYAVMQNRQGHSFGVDATSGHEIYGVSVKLPTQWAPPVGTPSDTSPWGIFFQLHGPDSLGASPAIALEARDDFHINLCAGDLVRGGKLAYPVSHAFSNGALNTGQWVEFMLDIVWAADKTGSITVYRRNQGQMAWSQVFQALDTPTLQYKSGQAVGVHYWKSGYYRNAGLTFTSQLWLGPVVRGSNFADVATAAFGSE